MLVDADIILALEMREFSLQSNGRDFDEADIALFEAFAIFCGIGIHNTKARSSRNIFFHFHPT